MLHEIDDLCNKAEIQSHELLPVKGRIHKLEAQLAGPEAAKPTVYEKTNDANAVSDGRAGILRSISRTISAYHFGNCYARILPRNQRQIAKPAKTPQALKYKYKQLYALMDKGGGGGGAWCDIRFVNQTIALMWCIIFFGLTKRRRVFQWPSTMTWLAIMCMVEIIYLLKSSNVMILEEYEFLAAKER
ncbi:hypothetical protein TraAM80_00986 [Trypanosoma rangeli]|uniref:Uncharacterized protein n=1 Tax=Trypanosoma rangeli TaxID=5698 RepID=A0A422P0Y1_TRYRA|nr:uncharacterized protein TraAM80_00986 [Trypanosoma rangeli]RNF11349.1 hypothetical protein TraAM80_00986 [Trypanosoma rangeli]|eukprot:RNF11349.1 hypothetical protein TraAM80_00986 [Trypanosoma rangeli]